MQARPTIVVAVAVTAAVLVLEVYRRGARDEMAELRAEVARMKSERAPRPREVVWRSELPVQAPTEPAKADPGVQPARIDPRARVPAPPAVGESPIAQFAQVHDALEGAFGAETSDAAWAMDASRRADVMLTAELPARSALRSVDCRATLCRVESAHDNYNAAREFATRLSQPDGRPWNGAFYTGPTAQDAGGGVTFVTYLAREGAAMPAIPDPIASE